MCSIGKDKHKPKQFSRDTRKKKIYIYTYGQMISRSVSKVQLECLYNKYC